MEVDRAVAIEQSGRSASRSGIASLQHKLEASEAARLARGGSAAASPGGAGGSQVVGADAGARADACRPASRGGSAIRAGRRATGAEPEAVVVARAQPVPDRGPFVGPEEGPSLRGGRRSGGRSRFRLRSPFRPGPSSKRRSPSSSSPSAGPSSNARRPRGRSSKRPSPRRRTGRRNTAARAGARSSPPPGARPDRSAARADRSRRSPSPCRSRRSSRRDDGGCARGRRRSGAAARSGTPAGPESASDLLDPAGGTRRRNTVPPRPPRPSRQARANRRAQEAGIERASGGGRAAPIAELSRVVGTARSGAGTTVSRQVLCDA